MTCSGVSASDQPTERRHRVPPAADEHRLIGCEITIRDPVDLIAVTSASRLVGEHPTKTHVEREGSDMLTYSSFIAYRCEQPGLSMGNDLGDPGDRVAHHGNSEVPRL